MSDYQQQLQALQDAVVGTDGGAQADLYIRHARQSVFSPEQRVAVYAGGYKDRLIDATLADYPALAHAMGEVVCKQAIAAYVEVTPSYDWDLNRYPLALRTFLMEWSDHVTFHALAVLESAIAEVFWLAESEPLNVEALAQLSPEVFAQQHFRLRKAAKLLEFPYEVNRYLTAYRDGEPLSAIASGAEYLLVYRPHYEVVRLNLAEEEYRLLAALHAGASFDEALESHPDPGRLEENLPAYLSRWMQEGVFTGTDS